MEEKFFSEFKKGEILIKDEDEIVYVARMGQLPLGNLVIIDNQRKITAINNEDRDKNHTPLQTDKKNGDDTNRLPVPDAFRILAEAGIPTTYVGRVSDSETEFLADKCRPFPLEISIARYSFNPFGSEWRRNPWLFKDKVLSVFHERPLVRFFLDTPNGELIGRFGEKIIEDLEISNSEGSPCIINPHEPCWTLFHPQKPLTEPQNRLGYVPALKAYGVNNPETAMIISALLEEMAIASFCEIEKHLNRDRRLALADIRFRFGITDKEKVVICEIIDTEIIHGHSSQRKSISVMQTYNNIDSSNLHEQLDGVAQSANADLKG